jgi:hypothetical protein
VGATSSAVLGRRPIEYLESKNVEALLDRIDWRCRSTTDLGGIADYGRDRPKSATWD